MFIKLIAFSCLVVASVSGGQVSPRAARSLQHKHNHIHHKHPHLAHHLAASASQNVAQAVAAPGSDQAAKLAAAQQAKLHYVEIGPSLKGDYKFGYDTGSGPAGQSFREETRLDDGTVKGAYGYVDANGKQRIVKYTAGKNGFVVEGDQEAPGQAAAAAPAAAQQQQQPAEPVRRPQPAALPALTAQQPQQRPSFDDQAAFNRAAPSAEDRLRAEQQHAEGLRQHQLATQAALAQQQRIAQQLQLQQQQQLAAQQQQAAARPQQAPQHQAQPQHQQHFGFPSAPSHQVADPQTGQFFSSSSDSNLNQLLTNQLRQLQSGNQFAGQFQPPPQANPAAQQQFAAQAAPAFQAAPQFQQPPPQAAPAFDFAANQFRGARQVGPTPQANQAGQVSPQSALIALHQQQQHDAQLLAGLRAQQLSQFQQQQQQQQQQQPRQAPSPQFQSAELAPQRIAPATQQPQPLAGAQPSAAAARPQPESFGPPVIDIRTLNYSIGQQTRVK